ncbi:hypothetical protein WY02_27030 [Pseudonocardia sp. AL041005-10]|nr:hypothetical protein WY02_27030 [Pseudonocardia sp. AL041005-10]
MTIGPLLISARSSPRTTRSSPRTAIRRRSHTRFRAVGAARTGAAIRASDTPPSTANSTAARPFTAWTSQDDPAATATCATIMPSTARPRAASTPATRARPGRCRPGRCRPRGHDPLSGRAGGADGGTGARSVEVMPQRCGSGRPGRVGAGNDLRRPTTVVGSPA